jgi:signal transduction histidine kinase
MTDPTRRATREAIAAVAEVLGDRPTPEERAGLEERLEALLRRWDEERQGELEAELGPVVDRIIGLASMLAEELDAHIARERELMQRLLHADRLAVVGQLADGVAHEVNNPASYIINNLGALRERHRELEALLGGVANALAEGAEPARALAKIGRLLAGREPFRWRRRRWRRRSATAPASSCRSTRTFVRWATPAGSPRSSSTCSSTRHSRSPRASRRRTACASRAWRAAASWW